MDCFAALYNCEEFTDSSVIARSLPIYLSLRGAKRRSNPEKENVHPLDCFATLYNCEEFTDSSVIARSKATKQSRKRNRASTGLLRYARNDVILARNDRVEEFVSFAFVIPALRRIQIFLKDFCGHSAKFPARALFIIFICPRFRNRGTFFYSQKFATNN